jgi:hypothetical protein
MSAHLRADTERTPDMHATPARRLAVGATATAILAAAFLIPAAAVAAEDLADPATETAAAAQAAGGEPASDSGSTPAPDGGAEPTAGDAEAAASEPVDGPAATPEQTDDAAAFAAAASAAAGRAASSAPVASLTGQAFIAAGDTWVGVLAIDDASAVRLAALGSRFEITMTDSAGASTRGAAADGYLDLWLNTDVRDGDITVAIRNTASAPQSIPYAMGWDTTDIRAFTSVSIGQPTLGISVFPRRGETGLAASVVARIVAADGVEQVVNLTGAPGYYHADVAGLAPGRYLVETDALVLGVHRYVARPVTVAAAETTPPTVALATAQQQAAGGWFPSAVDVTLTASDAGAGVHSLSWGVDTTQLSTTTAATTSFQVSGEGAHQVRYQAEDWQGNLSAIATRQINIDLTDPVPTLGGIADGDEFEQDERVAIEYACDDALSGVQSCVGDIGSGDFLDTSTPGTHAFRVTAIDKAGNEAFIERSYTVLEPDTTDPEIEVDVPPVPASGWYLDEVTVRLTASDASGIRRIHYEYDTTQGTVSRDIEADTAEVTFDRSQYYTLSYWAEDGAGNRSEGRDLHLYVDATAPWVDMITPADEPSILPNGHYAQHERVVIDFSCDDDASGIASCDATTPDGELLPTGTPGTHELRVVATDVAGHRTEHVVSYTVDAAPAPNGNGGVGGTGAPRLASTGADGLAGGVALAVLLLGAGAALSSRRRVRTR